MAKFLSCGRELNVTTLRHIIAQSVLVSQCECKDSRTDWWL